MQERAEKLEITFNPALYDTKDMITETNPAPATAGGNTTQK